MRWKTASLCPTPSGTSWRQSEQDAVVKRAPGKNHICHQREIVVPHTDEQARYVSESTVYRLLKANDRITSLAFILMQASDRFQHQTKRVNEMWQTDFTYYKVIGWGWYYLSTVMDDFSRYIVSWTLCTTMSAQDVKDTLDDVLSFTGLNTMKVKHKPAACCLTMALPTSRRTWRSILRSRI